jgi:hypothetical protein
MATLLQQYTHCCMLVIIIDAAADDDLFRWLYPRTFIDRTHAAN